MNHGKPSEAPAHLVLMRLAQGPVVAKALQAAAELGIADLLADGPKTVAQLAGATETNADALFRVLRALASVGIFQQDASGRFEQTAMSEPMRSDSPVSVRDYVIYAPNDGNMRAWMNLLSVLKTGEPAFVEANGCPPWEHFAQNPKLAERFNRAMTSLSLADNRVILGAYDFSPFKTLLDIGGGQGMLLAGLLQAHSHLRAALFELASLQQSAADYLTAQGVADRCRFLAGDAFDAIPQGFDGYLMKKVLHDWSDDDCARILDRCRAAIPPHGKLIILDAVMTPGNDPHPAKWLDLHMMVSLGGRERSEEQFDALLSRAGFQLTMVKPLPAPIGIVEAVPV